MMSASEYLLSIAIKQGCGTMVVTKARRQRVNCTVIHFRRYHFSTSRQQDVGERSCSSADLQRLAVTDCIATLQDDFSDHPVCRRSQSRMREMGRTVLEVLGPGIRCLLEHCHQGWLMVAPTLCRRNRPHGSSTLDSGRWRSPGS